MEILNLQTNFKVLIYGTESTARPLMKFILRNDYFSICHSFWFFRVNQLLLDDISHLLFPPPQI